MKSCIKSNAYLTTNFSAHVDFKETSSKSKNLESKSFVNLDNQNIKYEINELKKTIFNSMSVSNASYKQKVAQNFAYFHSPKITFYKVPTNLEDLETFSALDYLIKYASTHPIRRKQLLGLFSRHKKENDYSSDKRELIEFSGMCEAIIDFFDKAIETNNVRNMLTDLGIQHECEPLSFGQFEAVCLFSERYFSYLNVTKCDINTSLLSKCDLNEKLDFQFVLKQLNTLHLNESLVNCVHTIARDFA